MVDAAALPSEARAEHREKSGTIITFDPEVRIVRISTSAGQKELATLDWQMQWAIERLGLSTDASSVS